MALFFFNRSFFFSLLLPVLLNFFPFLVPLELFWMCLSFFAVFDNKLDTAEIGVLASTSPWMCLLWVCGSLLLLWFVSPSPWSWSCSWCRWWWWWWSIVPPNNDPSIWGGRKQSDIWNRINATYQIMDFYFACIHSNL